MIAALNLYRRHRRRCKGGHPEESRTGQVEEGRRGWKRCACHIFVAGTLNGKFKRVDTGRAEWDEAKLVAETWKAAQTWDGPVKIEQPTSSAEPAPQKGITVKEAFDAYVATRHHRGIQPPTLSKYRTLGKQLLAFCDSRGYTRVDQLRVVDMDQFYESWKDGIRSKAKKLERLKGFVQFSLKRKWLMEDITDDLKAPEGSSIPANKAPFTNDELDKIYAACDSFGGPVAPGPGHRNWGGADMKDFVMLSVYTGLRISDVATFDITQKLKGNDVFLRMHKTGKELFTWIPDWMVARLRAREKKYGPFIFKSCNCGKPKTIAELWRVKLKKVFKRAGPFEEPPTPHRFRHTFARILLESGVPIADVAELLGDTPDVVRKHYAKWVPGRQARLSSILQDALGTLTVPR